MGRLKLEEALKDIAEMKFPYCDAYIAAQNMRGIARRALLELINVSGEITAEQVCPCCGWELEFQKSCHEMVPDKYQCGMATCWFGCNAEDLPRISEAMKLDKKRD